MTTEDSEPNGTCQLLECEEIDVVSEKVSPIRGTTIFLNATCTLPIDCGRGHLVSRKKRKFLNFFLVSICIFSLVFMAIFLFITGIFGHMYYEWCTIWHPRTFMMIILSLKPLQGCVNLTWALCTRQKQRLMIFAIHRLYKAHQRVTHIGCGYFRTFDHIVRIPVILAVLFFFGLQLLYDTGQHWCWLEKECFNLTAALQASNATGEHDAGDEISIHKIAVMMYRPVPYALWLILPTYTIFQLAPLTYYIGVLYLSAKWLSSLADTVDRNSNLPMKPLLEHFREQAAFQYQIGSTFHGFVFTNLVIVVCTLCLFTYIITNSNRLTEVGETGRWAFYFNVVWCVLQILVLIIYLTVVCIGGYKTNEALFCLSEKFRMQGKWGISVWRGTLIQRGLLFSIFGLIATYAMVLLRMRNPTIADSAVCPF